MTITPIRPPAVCECGATAASGRCHQWPVCGFDDLIPRAATRYTSQTAPATKDPR